MIKTDKEVLELCKEWFEDIMERSEKLTSGNVAHGRAAIRGVAKNYAEFVAEHLEERWKPSDEQIKAIRLARSFVTDDFDEHPTLSETLIELEAQLKKLKEA